MIACTANTFFVYCANTRGLIFRCISPISCNFSLFNVRTHPSAKACNYSSSILMAVCKSSFETETYATKNKLSLEGMQALLYSQQLRRHFIEMKFHVLILRKQRHWAAERDVSLINYIRERHGVLKLFTTIIRCRRWRLFSLLPGIFKILVATSSLHCTISTMTMN